MIPSDGERMNALLLLAQGAGPHPPLASCTDTGATSNLALGQALRRTLLNGLYFNYRGSWGSVDTFSFSGAQDDVRATLRFLRAPRPCDTFGVVRRDRHYRTHEWSSVSDGTRDPCSRGDGPCSSAVLPLIEALQSRAEAAAAVDWRRTSWPRSPQRRSRARRPVSQVPAL